MAGMLPRILVTGMPRAGSTRVYNLIREALSVVVPEVRHGHCGSHERLDLALSNPSPGVFKEHTFSADTQDRIMSGDLLAVATIREPLPALISLCAAFDWPPEAAVREVQQSLECLEPVAAQARLVSFRSATNGHPGAVRTILAATGVHVGPVAAMRLSAKWGRRRARRLSAELKSSDLTHDPVNLLHPGHVEGPRQVDAARMAYLREAVEELDLERRIKSLASRAM